MKQTLEYVEISYPVCLNGDNGLADFYLELSFIVAKTNCSYDPKSNLSQLRRKERRRLDKLIETWQEEVNQTVHSDLSRLNAQIRKTTSRNLSNI